MKKIVVIVATIFGLLFLFLSDTKDNKTKVISAKRTATNFKRATVEDQYLWGLHSFHDARVEAIPDKDLIVAGQNACSLLDESYPISNVIIDLIYTDKYLNKDRILANEILANAVFTMCKQFIPQVNAFNP